MLKCAMLGSMGTHREAGMAMEHDEAERDN